MSAPAGSTTERSAQIRAALKAQGWTSRDVSVRSQYYSMGSSIHVRINNADVPLAAVETIANAHERIDRDGFGEILSGGNRFVHVAYSTAAHAALAARYADVVGAAATELDATPDTNRLIPIGATGFLIGRGYNGYGYSLWGHGAHIQAAESVDYLAAILAVRLQ